MTDRITFLNELVGKPWRANAKGPDAFDCYHLVQYVQQKLWSRTMLDVDVPNEPSWMWIVRAIDESLERLRWQEVEALPGNMDKLKDGSIVLMCPNKRAAHLGVWLNPEMGVLHVDKPDGVYFHDLATLNAIGWQKLKFFEYR